MSCITKLATDIVADCTVNPKAGIKNSKGVLLNFDDVDRASTKAASEQAPLIITSPILKSGTSGYSIDWFKRLGSTTSEFAPSTDAREGFTHSVSCRIDVVNSTEGAKQIEALQRGRYMFAYESEGDNDGNPFKVLGFESGLYASAITYASNENGGSVLFTLSSMDGVLEPTIFAVIEDDYATALAAFNSKYASV